MSAGAAAVPADGRTAESERGAIIARLIAFAALSALVASRWLSLISRPPVGRGIAALAAALAGAAVLAALGRRERLPRSRIVVAAVTLTTIIAGLVAIGLDPRLLAPLDWGTLGRDLWDGLSGAFAASYPYRGADPWTRTVILLGLPLLLGTAARLAFAPTPGERLRTRGLATLFAAWAIASALNAPAAPVVWGVGLFAAVAAWLWLGRMQRAIAAPVVVLLGVAAAAAIPLAVALDRGRPVLDYRHWNLDLSSPAGRSIFYNWDHTYGPLRWPRSGRTLFTVTGTGAQYWRVTTLDSFNGFRWVASTTTLPQFQLPAPANRAGPASRVGALDPRWVHRARFDFDALSSDLVVAPGTVLRMNGANVAEPSMSVSSSGDVLGDGDSYSVVAYEPDATPAELRNAPARLASGLWRYAQIELPPIAAHEAPANSPQRRANRARTPSVRTVEPPVYGRSGGVEARRLLARSAYGDVYALTRRLTADSKTEYGAVEAIGGYLRTHYTYSESPPRRALPLRAFLFRDRIGYCQQFSGAMALMLRMIGIPTRVASGFSPGIRRAGGPGYEVRDLDAHSWVEVYFNGIGWVPFDPTPSAAPAASRLAIVNSTGARPGGHAGSPDDILTGNRGGSVSGGGAVAWPWIGVGLALLAAALAIVAVRRRSRFLALPAGAAGRAQARELGALATRLRLERDRAITLLELERRLRTIAGPAAAVYVGALRAARFGRDGALPPTLRDRRRLRRALYAGFGLRGRIAGLVAIPPGGPR